MAYKVTNIPKSYKGDTETIGITLKAMPEGFIRTTAAGRRRCIPLCEPWEKVFTSVLRVLDDQHLFANRQLIFAPYKLA